MVKGTMTRKTQKEKGNKKGEKTTKIEKNIKKRAKGNNTIVIFGLSDNDALELMKQTKQYPRMVLVKECEDDEAMSFMGVVDHDVKDVTLVDEEDGVEGYTLPYGNQMIYSPLMKKWLFLD